MVTANLETKAHHPVRNRQSAQQNQDQSVWEAAAEMERRRLARDLHHTVIQTLFAANVMAESLANTNARLPDELRSDLDELRQLIQRASTETRDLLSDMRPTIPIDKPITLMRVKSLCFQKPLNAILK